MDKYEGILRVIESAPQKDKKDKKGGKKSGSKSGVKKIYELHYTKKKGGPGVIGVANFDLEAYADGAPCVFEMEGGRVTSCEIGGQTLSPIDASAAREAVQAEAGKAPEIVWGRAPYNFSSYIPDLIAPSFDREEKIWSGRILCELEALTPILAAQIHEKNADESSNCRFLEIDGKPVIPGSSIKGMLRSVMEILSFSGMRPMNKKKLFWRDVQDPDHYIILFDSVPRGGFMRQHGADFEITEVEVTGKEPDDESLYRAIKTGKAVGEDTPHTYYFRLPTASDKPEPVDADAVSRLWEQLTEDQKKRPHVQNRAKELRSKTGLPVFFRRSENGEIAELGFCRYFRLQYRYSPYELAWPDARKRDAEDIAESIFGYAGKDDGKGKKSLRGRIAVESFALEGEKYGPKEGLAAILGGPRPSCAPCYLEQNAKKINATKKKDKNYLKNMASYNDPKARLRGRKLYWHSVETHNLKPPAGKGGKESKKILSHLFPLRKGARGSFAIHVRGLTESELGCLFEALELKENCAHKLGMGKPLGLGSARIRIREARLEKMPDKYASLAARLERAAPQGMGKEERERLREKFRRHIFDFAKRAGAGAGARDFYELAPIRQLLRILCWEKQADAQELAYMTLEEYQTNAVLPQPGGVETFPIKKA